MRILVTGGAGFIGSHVVDAFIAAGHHVAVVDSLVTGKRENLNPKATFYEVDIRDAALLAEVFDRVQREIVELHAAQVNVRSSIDNPGYDAEVNVLGALNVLEQARLHGVRKVIFISSGGAIYGEPEYLPCDEAHPIHPLSPYGAGKYAIEVYLNVYRATFGLETTVLRYANVYGPRQDPHGEAGVVAIFAGHMLTGESVLINGSGEQERDFIYVGDCARANLLALERGAGDVYNLGSGVGTSINHIAALLQELTGYEGEPVHGPAKLGETFRIYLDAGHARGALGWTQTFALREGLQRTVDYFRKTAKTSEVYKTSEV